VKVTVDAMQNKKPPKPPDGHAGLLLEFPWKVQTKNTADGVSARYMPPPKHCPTSLSSELPIRLQRVNDTEVQKLL
jgi:hypothetical protein